MPDISIILADTEILRDAVTSLQQQVSKLRKNDDIDNRHPLRHALALEG